MSSGNDDNNRTIPSLVNGAIHHKKKNYREFEKYSKSDTSSHRDDKPSQSHHNEDSRYFSSRKSESYSGRYSSHRESSSSKYGSDTRVVIRPSSQSETSSSKHVSSWSNRNDKDKINSSQRTSYDRDIQSYAKLQRSRSKSSEKGQPDLMDLAISSTSSRDKNKASVYTRLSQDKDKPTNLKSNSESSMEESVDREIDKAKMQKAKRNELRRARRRWRKMNCESSKQSSSELDNSGQEKHSDSERDEKSGSEPAQKLKKSENLNDRKCDQDYSRTSTEKTDMKSERIVVDTSKTSSEIHVHSKRQSRSPARSTRHSPQKSFHRSPSKSDSTCSSSPLKIDHRSPRRSDSSSSSPQKSVRHSPYKSNRRSPFKSNTHRTDKNIHVHSTPKSDRSSKKIIPVLEDKNDTTIEEGELKSSESCLSDDCQSQNVSNRVKESSGAASAKDLQKENSELKTTISELTFELETKGKALERFSQDYDFKIENLQETYSEEIESLKEEISYLKRDSDREREITDKAKAKEKDLQNKVGRLEDGLLHSGKENLELHEKIKKLEEENSTLRLYNNYPNPYTPQTRTDYGYQQVWK